MVKIIDGWYFIPESNQYTLIHEYEKPKGTFGKKKSDTEDNIEIVTKQEEIGYFMSLSGMLKGLARILTKQKYDDGEINNIKDFTKVYDTFSKGLLSTTAEQATQLQHAKGGMEVIKMIGSGLILTILCPLVVAKMVSPVMKAINPIINPDAKEIEKDDDDHDDDHDDDDDKNREFIA